MAQENCQICRRDGATTPETSAAWVVCTSSAPLIYTCDAHLEEARRIAVERYGSELTYEAVVLTNDTERTLQLARLKLPAHEQRLAYARIKLKTMKKAGSNYGVYRSCGKRAKVARKEWDRAANPKCPGCGGMLDREEQAMSGCELTRHENSLRRDEL